MITLVTGNKGKLAEWQRLVKGAQALQNISLDLPEIQSMNPHEIVTEKAKKAYELLQQPLVVEDVSAGLASLQGLPGPFIKYFEEKLGSGALRILAQNDGEAATVMCTVAYIDAKHLFTVQGIVKGTVVTARGENGFGFDKVFIPNGQHKTYGQMTPSEKDAISHRSKAVTLLMQKLSSLS